MSQTTAEIKDPKLPICQVLGFIGQHFSKKWPKRLIPSLLCDITTVQRKYLRLITEIFGGP